MVAPLFVLVPRVVARPTTAAPTVIATLVIVPVVSRIVSSTVLHILHRLLLIC